MFEPQCSLPVPHKVYRVGDVQKKAKKTQGEPRLTHCSPDPFPHHGARNCTLINCCSGKARLGESLEAAADWVSWAEPSKGSLLLAPHGVGWIGRPQASREMLRPQRAAWRITPTLPISLQAKRHSPLASLPAWRTTCSEAQEGDGEGLPGSRKGKGLHP